MTTKAKRWLSVIFVWATTCTSLRSQIMPAEGSKLNYRIIGFYFPASLTAKQYKLEIASGNYKEEHEFEKNIINTLFLHNDSTIIEVPEFNKYYTWRVSYNDVTGKLYHFKTGYNKNVDTSLNRLRIKKKATKHEGSYIFVDNMQTVYSMDGYPVWYLPVADISKNDVNSVRDLKCSNAGTITYLKGENIYEVDYNNNILWEGPGNYTTIKPGEILAHYHHQFTRLNNDHYMVAGTEYLERVEDSLKGTISYLKSSQNNKDEFGDVIEYDKNGNELWRWHSSDYYTKQKAYIGNILLHKDFSSSTHENAFFFDESRNELFVSFRNISQILKIKYPEGTVSGVYGAPLYDTVIGKSPFHFQHSCNISKNGDLYLFNNNKRGKEPEVLVLNKPMDGTEEPEVKWRYKYPAAELIPAELPVNMKNHFFSQGTSGGNVIELSDGCLFVSYCEPHAEIFIVSKKKTLLWDATAEHRNNMTKRWEPSPTYRANIISRKQLEKLIWNQKRESKTQLSN